MVLFIASRKTAEFTLTNSEYGLIGTSKAVADPLNVTFEKPTDIVNASMVILPAEPESLIVQVRGGYRGGGRVGGGYRGGVRRGAVATPRAGGGRRRR